MTLTLVIILSTMRHGNGSCDQHVTEMCNHVTRIRHIETPLCMMDSNWLLSPSLVTKPWSDWLDWGFLSQPITCFRQSPGLFPRRFGQFLSVSFLSQKEKTVTLSSEERKFVS